MTQKQHFDATSPKKISPKKRVKLSSRHHMAILWQNFARDTGVTAKDATCGKRYRWWAEWVF
ncbi:hypothetical protein JCM14202_2310 [Agrilactobacillus composti DSM 18527 = JCM 14202]|nr:hypothetical protein JCM14202_2310 [Agrilactobacillus composti DSM 18527 = JCM 14202]